MTILAAFSFYTEHMLLFREALVRIFCHSIIIGLDFDNIGQFWFLTTACSLSFDLLVGVIVVVEGPLSWWWVGLLVGWLVGCIDRRLPSWYQIEPSTQTIDIPLSLSIWGHFEEAWALTNTFPHFQSFASRNHFPFRVFIKRERERDKKAL